MPPQGNILLQDNPLVHEIMSHADSIIFDMDGLMIDSEPLHQKAFDAVFKSYDKHLSVEENNKFYVGISDKDAAEDMVKRFELPLSPIELVTRKQKAYLDFLQQIRPQEGLLELLKKLKKKKYKKAIASSSMLSEIGAVVDALKIKDSFQALCSAEQVEYGKPAPDLFLFAARQLNSDPSQCVVLEDAPSGVAAAKDASMQCIVVPSNETRNKDFTNASLKLDSLSVLANAI